MLYLVQWKLLKMLILVSISTKDMVFVLMKEVVLVLEILITEEVVLVLEILITEETY